MAPEPTDDLRERGRSLEDEFFRRQDAQLLARLRERKDAEARREALAKVTGITNAAVLDRLTKLGIRAETVAALRLVPLVEVAWADGTLDPSERNAILARAHESGIPSGSPEAALLEGWLAGPPDAALRSAWTQLVQGLCEVLQPAEIAQMRAGLLDRARAVAGASGGLLGLGKVSAAESEAIARLEAAFHR
ncbi:MAG TPA: hypothetical protein VLD61_07125 [Methylomirabilota bacterium]|nr:hypothetical protein [Methylomirabilota bacterium]